MNDLKYLNSYWNYLKESKGLLFTALIIIPFIALFHLVQPLLIKTGIDNYILKNNYHGFITISALFFISLVAEFLLKTIQVFLFQYIGQFTIKKIRKDLYYFCLNLPQSYFDKTPIGTVTTRLTTDMEALNESFASGLVTLITDIITIIGIFIAMAYLNLKLTLYCLILLPILYFMVNFFRINLRRCYDKSRTAMSNLNSFLQEQLQGIEIVQLFGKELQRFSVFNHANTDYKDATIKAVKFDSILYSLIDALSSILVGLIIWVSLPDIDHHVITLGLLIAFIDYINKLFSPLKELSSKFAVLQNALSALEKIFTLFTIDLPHKNTQSVYTEFNHSIHFKQVSYTYKGFNKQVLKTLSFSIKKGSTIALVGPTGSGKSTIIRLLSGLYDDYKGDILIDSTQLSSLSGEALGDLITTVSQTVSIFSNTIKFNITLGRDVNEKKLNTVIEALQLSTLLSKFDDGIDTVLTHGIKHLSKGEAQLISFARALVSTSPILILDEATSSLDSLTESVITKALSSLSNDKTIIIIAHRLSTIKHADMIYVLNDGQFIESGDHQKLMDENGFYAKLYKLQLETVKTYEQFK